MGAPRDRSARLGWPGRGRRGSDERAPVTKRLPSGTLNTGSVGKQGADACTGAGQLVHVLQRRMESKHPTASWHPAPDCITPPPAASRSPLVEASG